MQNVKNVLITGGSGLIGKRLTELLVKKGYEVAHLGRSKKNNGVKSFIWDIDQQKMEEKSFENIDTIVHLAGAGIADKRWNKERKQEILQSRTESTRLLKSTLQKRQHHVKTFIAASAIGFYGFEDAEKDFKESDAAGKDFTAQVTTAWENETDKVRDLGLRTVKIRIGIVLSEQGGALEKLATPIKLMAGAPLGSGDQYLSWIHIDDVCSIFIKAIEDNSMQGAYNAVAPYPVTNQTMTKAIAKTLHKPLLLPHVPAFVLKLIVGEMAEIVINGAKVSSNKIQKAGYNFQFKTLQSALNNLLLNRDA